MSRSGGYSPSPHWGEGRGEGAQHIRGGTVSPHPSLFPPGRGLVSAVPSQAQFLSDRLEHTMRVLEHLIVPEAQNLVTECFDRVSAWCVEFRRVLAAIQFDDQSCRAAGKVGDVGANRELTDEFRPFETPPAQVVPQPVFGIGAPAAQLARDWTILLFWQRRTPSPQPSPLRGEGVSSAHRGRSLSFAQRGEATRRSRAGEGVPRIRKAVNA